MNSLIEDVKLVVDAQIGKGDRLCINSGTIQMFDVSSGYEEGAFVPLQDWRPLTNAELACLLTEKIPSHIGQCMRVIQIPDSIFSNFSPVRRVATEAELEHLETKTSIIKAKDQLRQYLNGLSALEITEIGLGLNQPDLPTVTREELLIGLHIDSCDKQRLEERIDANNRFMLNVGNDSRSLVFMNRSIQGMIHDLESQGYDSISLLELGATNIARLFMNSNPSYPIIRLRIFPKEAYIAPTENIIHDGCTVGMCDKDIFITSRARFLF